MTDIATEPIRFLLFRGQWENEGIFSVLETEQDIIIISTGKDYHANNEEFQQLGKDYLEEKKDKIKGIIILNTDYRNVSFLENLCQDLGQEVIIFTSYYNRIIIQSSGFLNCKNKIQLIEADKEYFLGDISTFFLHCSSYSLGNLGVSCHFQTHSFFFFKIFCLTLF